MTAAAGPQVLVSAGDASGDLHAADFVRTFRARSPGARFFGLGGPALEKAGVELVCSQRDLAIGGLVEIAGGLGRVVRAWRRLTSALAERQADLVLLVDSGGFNLPFARRAHAARAPVLYYVAPQVWAWRTGRIRKLARRVDQVAVIFPFEVEVYRGTGVAATFVGHPLVDPMRELCGRLDRAGARRALGLEVSGSCVALLPGSRRNEIGAHLRTQLATARLLHERDPRSHFVLAVAPSLTAAGIEAAARAQLPPGFPLHVVAGQAAEAIRAADVVLAKPGTVTVEATLLERPMVVMGRANALTAAVLRRALRVPWLAMPNLIAGEALVPEFLQQDAVPERLAPAVAALLEGPARDRQLAGLAAVAESLGEGGAAARACALAEEMIAAPRS